MSPADGRLNSDTITKLRTRSEKPHAQYMGVEDRQQNPITRTAHLENKKSPSYLRNIASLFNVLW